MKISISSKNRFWIKAGVILIWLIIWEITSHLVDNGILLVGPVRVLNCLIRSIITKEFWLSIWGSFFKIAIGFIAGGTAGLILAAVSYKIPVIKTFLAPFMAFVKATPVASFIVLFLIWWHADSLSVAVAICIVLPQIYVNTLSGFESVDKGMIRMSHVYKWHTLDRFHYIYKPTLLSYMESAIKVSAGMAWKAGIAAEVIGTPDGTIGEKLYMAKIYLDTEGVLAWTVVIIVISVLCERFLLRAYRWYNSIEPKCIGSSRSAVGIARINLDGIEKSYGDNEIIKNLTVTFEADNPTVLDWESGSGKTSLFKIIAGEIKAEAGTITPYRYEVSMLFQEDRLCENYSAIKNVALVTGDERVARDELVKLLDEESINRPVCELSGGQKRRVALVRACASKADVYLLDEPFTGLDENNRHIVGEYIKKKLTGKVVVIASHVGDVMKEA